MPTTLDLIDAILDEPVEHAAARERLAFDNQLSQTDGTVVLFGAGRLGRICARGLESAKVCLRAFCDNDISLQGRDQNSIPVMAPSEAVLRFGRTALFVVSIWTGTAKESMATRIQYLRDMGCHFVVPFCALAWAHAGEELPFHSFDLPSKTLRSAEALRQLAYSLADDRSRDILNSELRRRLMGDFAVGYPESDQYFPSRIMTLTKNEVVVDGGAFTGDTLIKFLANTHGFFSRYYAFEPDKINAAEFSSYCRNNLDASTRQRIVLRPYALSATTAIVPFEVGVGERSKITEAGTGFVETVRLDDILSAEDITYIKFDIEGSEADALVGGQMILECCAPTSAICVYHRPDDLVTVPSILSRLLPDHSFFLGDHGYDGWELVFYAIRSNHLRR